MVKVITRAAREGGFVAYGDCTDAVVKSVRRTDETFCIEPLFKSGPVP